MFSFAMMHAPAIKTSVHILDTVCEANSPYGIDRAASDKEVPPTDAPEGGLTHA
jgi:hypothetical protein